jgi:hypothetical protein
METKQYFTPGPGMGRMKLAHAYVPYQFLRDTYSPREALMKGTLFPELYMPYRPNHE